MSVVSSKPIKVLCANCRDEVLFHLEVIRKQSLACAKCGWTIDPRYYPQVQALIEEANRRDKEAAHQAKETLKEYRRQEKEVARQKRELEAERKREAAEVERQAALAHQAEEEKRIAEEDHERLKLGVGCPQCGSNRIVREKVGTATGSSLTWGGLLIALFTCGIGLIIAIVGACLKQERCRCEKCGWTWQP